MNRIFKVLWNAATGTFVVTSETAKSRGKKNGRRKLAVSALIGLSSIMVSADALANAGNDTGDGVTPTGTQTGGKGWIAIGTDATANTYTNVDGASAAMGYKASAMGKWSTAIGSYSQSTGDSSLALGVKSVSAGDRAIAMGASSSASGSYSMAMGVYANSSGAKSVALGYKSVASGATSSALGYQATASGDDSAAFGNGAKAIGTNSVALGSGSVAQEDNSVAVGNSTTQRQITYVAKGDINSTSTDAVTGAQIYSLSQSVADRLGGGASVNSDGTVNAPLYEVGTGIYNNVGSALSALNTSITNTEASVAGLAEDALLWDESISAFSASHTGNASKITNLAAGTLAADSTDAVNGSQLFDTNEKVDQNTADITTNTNSINQNTTDIATNTTNINNLSDSITTLTDDALLWDAASGAFSANHNGSASKITNLAAGTLAADSTDAVNGSQLFATNENVSQNTADITTNTNSINQNTTDIATNTTSINNLSDSITTLTDDALLWDAASGTFSASRSGSASKITNLAAGTLAADSTDAVNGSQLYETNQKVDQNTSAIADINTSITNLSSDNLSWNETTSSFSASHGSSTTNKITNVAAGELSEESTDAVNGSQLFETNEKVDQNTTDIAANTTNITQNSTAIENLNTSVSDINTSITGLTDNALLWDEDTGAFSANHGGSTSKITNVAAGALSEDSTDAVNGSQLYETNQKVDQNTSAIADINTSITNLGTDALSWDDEEGAFSASHGTSGTNKITNVAAGEIASDSTDAVNGSQLYETNMLISQYNESISQLAGDTSETYITENGTGVKYIRTNDNGLEGQDAYATGNGATAVGYDAVASGAGSLALGQNSSSSIEGSIALGSGSTSNRAITTGIRETSATSDGVVIGYNTTDRELLGALSLGTDGESYRQITNVADGSEAQDAVTVRQLQNAIGAVTTTPTKYYHANSTEEDSLAVGTDSLAMGAKTIVNADAGIGIGLNTLVMADAINGIAIGSNARANHANSIAMGNGSQTTRGAQTDYTAYNMDTPQNSVGEFSVGSEDGQRQITNVAAGSADTDAVNVGQLKVTDAQVSRNTQSITNLNTQVSNLDTRVTNIENGIGDIVTTGSTKYFKTNTDGADANAQGADSVAIGSGSIAAAENSVALGTNSVADEANTVSVGSSTQQRRITNVAAGVNNTDAVNVAQLKASEAGSVRYETNADGSVNYSVLNLGDGSGGTTRIGNVSAAVNDTDAVNYAQLKRSVEEANTYTDQKMGEMNSKIKGVENKMSGGIASAMAMAGLPQAYAPGANMTSIAGGTFNGESAVAIGVSMVSESGGWVYKLQGTSNSQGDYSAAIGAGFQW
ncbi:trimeric autotransporter adhesin SadA [Salmonella enterica]|uniref:Autotransporter adhesin SadA n=2 Tax=Salmonella enterica TaxID=28901 RepID=A0A5Z7MMM1_SALET|nr:trimeric autotransporter adhesin SadA [Salmonella enterica]ECS6647425.1 autotransporter adhesin SadA [Salmonella enterica subsp. enterica serovar 4,[5],12:i:-]EDB3999914.1 autotransporter adhesin SadA [Salmonella enterica subsp. enterica serovar Typhimurium]HAV0747960.1 autotransporter adhesin SadA [Salmonella enterica subsp. enterica]HCT0736638.1 trimeric autotransporter adhesin SadA [Salmonella enterica subsp. enterica serovar 1,4,[5],12:i:-]EAO3334956.1 autotransporter adhesin SadA [Salm